MTTLTYISSSNGDWCAIYIDNKLYTEGHSIAVWEWLHIITTQDIKSAKQYEINGTWLKAYGSYPMRFTDIPEEVF
jgi:hypothetical protein